MSANSRRLGQQVAQPVHVTPSAQASRVRFPFRTTAKLVLLLLLLPGCAVLGVQGLLVLPLMLGPFFAYAFHLTRPVREDPHDDAFVSRFVYALCLLFLPGIIGVAGVTAFVPDEVHIGWLALEGFLLGTMYLLTVAGAGLSSYHIIMHRATSGEKKVLKTLRWPVLGALGWVLVFLALDLFFRRPFMSVDYAALGSVGLYAGGALLVAWLAMAGFRTFRPAPQDAAPRLEASPPVSPVFTPFRG